MKTANSQRNRLVPLWLLLVVLVVTVVLLIVLIVRQIPEQPQPKPPAPVAAIEEQPSGSWGGPFFYAGMPKRTSAFAGAVWVLTNAGYVVGYSEMRKNPVWVCYRVFNVDNLSAPPRPSTFRTDIRTKARVSTSDYTGSGYDRGHCAPNFAIAVCYGAQAQLETFLMSNILPQKPKLNREVWENLERTEIRDWAQRLEEVWVITGPVFDAQPKELKGGVQVPGACYRIVVDEERGQPRVLAFIVPQDVEGKEPFGRFLASVDDVERETGLDFFADLPDEIENQVESGTASRLW